MIRRREIIALLGGAAAAWPLAARAQQVERMRRIGVLLGAFLQGVQQLGWTIGRTCGSISAGGTDDADRIRRNVADVIALAPDVILVAGL